MTKKKAMQWVDKFIERKLVRPQELLANPLNPRQHSAKQAMATADALEELGWVGEIKVNRRTGRLFDGHLRLDLALKNGQDNVPVNYYDLAPHEESLALSVLDQLTTMATIDHVAFDALLQEVMPNSLTLQAMLAEMSDNAAKLIPPAPAPTMSAPTLVNPDEVVILPKTPQTSRILTQLQAGLGTADFNQTVEAALLYAAKKQKEELKSAEKVVVSPAEDGDMLDQAEKINEVWQCQTGQLWRIPSAKSNGEHRLLVGNCLESVDVARLMGDNLADMVFTDPPYNLKIAGLGSGTKYDKRTGQPIKTIGSLDEFAMASGEMSREEFTQFLSDFFKQQCRVSRSGSIHYICMDWRHVEEILTASRQHYSEYKNLIVWNKDNAGMGSFYRSKHELVFIFKHGKDKHINNFGLGETGRYRTNVWDYPMISSFALQKRDGNLSAGSEETSWHPTVKPLQMVADAILDCSLPDSLILDLFSGSGTTLEASEITGRIGYGMDIEPKYVAVSLERLKRRGLSPVLVG